MMHSHRRTFAAVAFSALAAVSCSSEPGSNGVEPTEEVSASAVPTADGTAAPGPDGSASPSDSASPSESPTDGASEPTDTDRARFASDYRPAGSSDLEHVQVDVDGDGVDELVFAYVRGGEGVGHVDVADWNAESGQYEIVAGADGGVADRIDRVRIADLNLDGVVEVALFQGRGSTGASVTLWAVVSGATAGDQRLAPLVARGGCWDGLWTYGVIGATLEDRDGDGALEVHATCDDSPLPASAWSTDVYRWQDNAYRHDPEL